MTYKLIFKNNIKSYKLMVDTYFYIIIFLEINR